MERTRKVERWWAECGSKVGNREKETIHKVEIHRKKTNQKSYKSANEKALDTRIWMDD